MAAKTTKHQKHPTVTFFKSVNGVNSLSDFPKLGKTTAHITDMTDEKVMLVSGILQKPGPEWSKTDRELVVAFFFDEEGLAEYGLEMFRQTFAALDVDEVIGLFEREIIVWQPDAKEQAAQQALANLRKRLCKNCPFDVECFKQLDGYYERNGYPCNLRQRLCQKCPFDVACFKEVNGYYGYPCKLEVIDLAKIFFQDFIGLECLLCQPAARWSEPGRTKIIDYFFEVEGFYLVAQKQSGENIANQLYLTLRQPTSFTPNRVPVGPFSERFLAFLKNKLRFFTSDEKRKHHLHPEESLTTEEGAERILDQLTNAPEFASELVASDFLCSLTAEERDIVSLHLFEGYTFREIAQELEKRDGKPRKEGTVRQIYNRALEKLAKLLPAG